MIRFGPFIGGDAFVVPIRASDMPTTRRSSYCNRLFMRRNRLFVSPDGSLIRRSMAFMRRNVPFMSRIALFIGRVPPFIGRVLCFLRRIVSIIGSDGWFSADDASCDRALGPFMSELGSFICDIRVIFQATMSAYPPQPHGVPQLLARQVGPIRGPHRASVQIRPARRLRASEVAIA